MNSSKKLNLINKSIKANTIVLYVSLILMFFSNKSIGQTIISNTSIAEKIYLQLDKDIYTTGSTIWFKAIISNAYTHKPNSLSSILYVELISPQEVFIEKKLIKISQAYIVNYFLMIVADHHHHLNQETSLPFTPMSSKVFMV